MRALLLVPAGLIALVAMLLLPVDVEAHSYVLRSVPAAGASAGTVPGTLRITFSEPPDPSLSSIRVTNSSGHSVTTGGVVTIPGFPDDLAVPLAKLPTGAYTVNWRVVSALDGHATAGAFAFGVGASVDLASATSGLLAAPATPLSPPGVAGRWIFYIGLGLLIGGAWLALFALPGGGGRLPAVTALGSVLVLAGLLAYGAAEAVAAGARLSLTSLVGTSLGRGLIAEAVPAAGAMICAQAALWLHGRPRTVATALVMVLAALTVLAHVLGGHAVASRAVLLMVLAQWAHILAFAAWIGGLAALLLAIGSRPSPRKAAAVRRFSHVAGFALATVGVTGLLRAYDEVATWGALVSSAFGQFVLLKIGLLLVLAALGGLHRLRTVPVVERSLAGLRRLGSVELGVGGALLLASAALTSLAPPAFASVAAVPASPPRVTVTGLASAVRAALEVSPGFPGNNRFTLRLTDSHSRKPIAATVQLRFQIPSRPSVAASDLELTRAGDGSYGALGENLSLIGDWSVVAMVQRTGGAVDVPLPLTVRASPQQASETGMSPTMPMAHGIRLANGWRLTASLSPGRAGRNTLHLVYADDTGAQADVPTDPTVTVRLPNGSTRKLSMDRLRGGSLARGHFITTDTFPAGRSEFHVVATGGDGARLDTTFTLTILK